MKNLLCTMIIFGFIACSSHQVTESEKKAEIFYMSGTQNLVAKRYSEALNDFLEAVKLDPNNSEIQNNLGMTYYFKNELNIALEHLKKAIELDPKNMDPVNNLASVYFAQGKYQESKIEYEKITKDLTYLNQFRTYYNLGLIELTNKNTVKARELFNKSVAENQNYCPAYFQLGTLDLEAQNFQSAYDNFKNAGTGECMNNAAEANYYQAISSWKLGNAERAKLKFIDVIKRFPKSPMAAKAQLQVDRLDKLEATGSNQQLSSDQKIDKAVKQSFVTPAN